MRTIYISRHDPERARKSALEYCPEAEIIETATLGLLWIENSVSTQDWLRNTGREHLVRPVVFIEVKCPPKVGEQQEVGK